MKSQKPEIAHVVRMPSGIALCVGAAVAGIWFALPAARAGDNGAGAPDSESRPAIAQPDQGAAIPNLSPTQIDQVKGMMGQGGPDAQQMQELCTGIATKHIGPADLESVGSSLGLTSEQISQLKKCSKGDRAAAPSPAGAGNGPAPRPAAAAAGRWSPIEASFRAAPNSIAPLIAPNPKNLEQFGYTLFTSPVSTFAPLGNVPVGANYVLGPGDQLNVLLWGRINSTLHLELERDGAVLVPEVGPIEVAGLTFGQAKKLIESRADQIAGVHVDVTMGTLRTLQVFVIGKVNQPGLYTVSALSHVSNALVAAGGIAKIGSLRRIELRRGNHIVRIIDLYDMLLHGSTAADLRLEPGDVIFVPVIGPVVGVVGDVKDPAIYELKGEESLKSVLAMAGGVGPFGYSRRVQVERIDNHARRIAVDIELPGLAVARLPVRDGDLVKVFTVLPQQQDIVTLKGNVNRPGVYQWQPQMRVADLLQRGEGVADNTFFGYAVIRRVQGADRQVRFVPVDLGRALATSSESNGDDSNADGSNSAGSNANITLQPRDLLTVYNEHDLGDLPKVTVTGSVRKGGSYPLSQGMRVSDLVYEAGGLADNAYLTRAELARTEIVSGSAIYIYKDVDLRRALSGMAGTDPLLKRGDMLFIQQASNWHRPWTVKVEGEVVRPGPYVIRDGERLDSLVLRCGGLRPDAYLPAAVFIRMSVKKSEQEELDKSRRRLKEAVAQQTLTPAKFGTPDTDKSSLQMIEQLLAETKQQQAVGRIVIHLGSLAETGSHSDLVLEDGDQLTIPKRPASVAVLGQVYSPGAVIYQPGRTVGSYLAQAGGSSQWADKDHILLIRADGEVLSEDGIRSTEDNRFFPLLPVISGGLMETRLEAGDTVYVPERLVYVSDLKYATDVTQIVANAATALAVVGILATSL